MLNMVFHVCICICHIAHRNVKTKDKIASDIAKDTCKTSARDYDM